MENMSNHFLVILTLGIILSLALQTRAICEEENISLDGQAHSSSPANSSTDCQLICDNTRCSHWVWKNGDCTLLRIADPGKKVGTLGAVAGIKGGNSCPLKTRGVQCHYIGSRDPVICLFPFVGETPGVKNASTQHESCLKSKKGHFWCATKLGLDNKLLATSDQTKDVECGLSTSNQGSFYCLSESSCPTIISVQERVAQLEKLNRDLQNQLTRACTGNQTSGTSSGAASGATPAPRAPGTGVPGTGAPGTPRAPASGASSPNSCQGRCDQPAAIGQCDCSSSCVGFGDCCSDYSSVCSVQSSAAESCQGKCGDVFNKNQVCQCNYNCASFNNCCADFSNICSSTSAPSVRPPAPSTGGAKPSSPPTSGGSTSAARPGVGADPLLGVVTESLLALDENNVMDKITLTTGCTTRVGRPTDCSSQNLFTQVDTSIFRKPVYEKLIAMYENYNPDITKTEDTTNAERKEEQDFIDEIMKTKVMKETLSFLRAQKYFTKSETDFKKLLQELWFGVYSRGNRILGSSGFEHVFLGEKKDGKVQGFHNWVYFYFLEQRKQVNYLGHWEKVDLGGRGTGLSFTFLWGQEQKPYASMLVGTSPELEIAVYTICLLAKGEEKCNISLGGQKIEIEVHVFNRPRGVRYIASSFMNWS